MARQAATDSSFRSFFSIKQRYHRLTQDVPPPPEVLRSIEELKAGIRDHYLRHYLSFYDILFVDESGYVLSTIRHQQDYHENLFEGKLAETSLSRRLREAPAQAFVDYEFYWASDEPSAFFVEPVVIENRRQGWLVCQCSLNRINDIFSREDDLGRTGEVFLANRRHEMITRSRLEPGQGALLRHLARENLEPKFAQGEGHRQVVDYRGFPVLTSFTVCRVLDSEWLLVAKIDEDEVLTGHFVRGRDDNLPLILRRLDQEPAIFCSEHFLPEQAAMVDMDEYRSSADRPLLTFGVSTCSALLMILPDGRAFLGHAGEQDRIYGGTKTDVLGNMLRTITRFHLVPYQVRDLEVVLVAPHRRSLAGTVDRLLDAGLLLSQIHFASVPGAESATLVHYPERRHTMVRWSWGSSDGRSSMRWQCLDDCPDLGAIYQRALDYP